MANIAFSRKPSNFNDYLAKLEDLMRKNRGSALNQGFDVAPNAQLLPGRVANASGLGNQQYDQGLQFDRYSPESVAFSAPNVGSSAGSPPTPQPDQGQVMGEQTSQGLSAQDFFNQVGQAIYSPEQNYVPSGTKNYSGIGTAEKNQVFPMASMPDGNILWSDGYVRAPQPSYLGSGVSALSQGLFGRNQAVTQPYGNYNPIEPSPGNINYGTDFRVKDLQDKTVRNLFNQALRVVEVYGNAQPGSGGVGNMENRGYGNSVLLALEDGSMIRVSHFDNLAPLRVGDTIQPGQEIGVAGATGNVTGAHSDVEVYSPEGKIVSPDQFTAQIRQDSTENKPLYQHNAGIDQQNQVTQSQPEQNQPSQLEQGMKLFMDDAKSYAQKYKSNTASAINQANPTGQFDLGITESLQNKPEEARQAQANTLQNIGTAIGAPELQTSELSNQQKTNPFRQLFGNLADVASTPLKKLGLPDLGISEAIAGGRTVNTDRRLAPGAMASEGQTMSRPPSPQDYAGVLGDNLKSVGDAVTQPIQQAGQSVIDTTKGLVQKAKDAFGKVTAPGIGQVPSPMQQSPDSIQVGQTSGDQSITASLPQKGGDNRDPFFKYGGATDFASYLKPNAEQIQGGALSTNLFNNDFYGNSEAVGSVFGKTSQAGEATNLYKQNLQSKIKPGFDQPYKEEIVNENGVTYKVLTPIKEYFENQFYKDKLANTPEKLTADFSYGDYEVPPVADQQNKGEIQTIPGDNPVFKSGAASMFNEAGDKTAQFVKGIGNKISDVYKANPFSKVVSLPEQLKQAISSVAKPNFNVPQQTRQVISVNGSNGDNGSNNQSSGGSQPSQQQPSHNQPAAISRVANYATGNIAKQISQPRPQPKPVYQPYQKLLDMMRSIR